MKILCTDTIVLVDHLYCVCVCYVYGIFRGIPRHIVRYLQCESWNLGLLFIGVGLDIITGVLFYESLDRFHFYQ